jgi:Family of unknown function (DUF6491)
MNLMRTAPVLTGEAEAPEGMFSLLNSDTETMEKYLLKSAVIILSSSCIVSCATSSTPPEAMAYEAPPPGNDCISQGSIRDYEVLDDGNLVVSAGVKRKYHVALMRRAFGLRSSWRIGFKTRSAQVCPGFSELVFDDGTGLQSIQVQSIRALTPDEYDDLLVRFGKKEPEVKQAPEPEKVEGAEVEGLD